MSLNRRAAAADDRREPQSVLAPTPAEPMAPVPENPPAAVKALVFRTTEPVSQSGMERVSKQLRRWAESIGLGGSHVLLLPHCIELHSSFDVAPITPEKAEEVRRRHHEEDSAAARKMAEELEKLFPKKKGDFA